MYSSSRSSRTSYANTNNNNLARDSYIHNNIFKTIGGIFGFIFISSGVLFQLYEQYKTEPVLNNKIVKANKLNLALAKADVKKEEDRREKVGSVGLYKEDDKILENLKEKEKEAEKEVITSALATAAIAEDKSNAAIQALNQVIQAQPKPTVINSQDLGNKILATEATTPETKAKNTQPDRQQLLNEAEDISWDKNQRKFRENAEAQRKIGNTNSKATAAPAKITQVANVNLNQQTNANPDVNQTLKKEEQKLLYRILNALGANFTTKHNMAGGAAGDNKKDKALIQNLIDYLQSTELIALITTMANGDKEKMKKMNEQRIVELETLKKNISHAHIDYEISRFYDLFFPEGEKSENKDPPAPNEKVYETKEELITSMYSYPIDPDVLDEKTDKSKQENNPFGFDFNVQRSNASAWDETMGVELFLLFLKHSGSTDKTSYFGKDGYYDKPMFTNKTTTTRKTPNFLHSGKEL